MTTPEQPKLRSGYGFIAGSDEDYREVENDDWEIIILPEEVIAEAKYVGTRPIDGGLCCVFRAADGTFYAQLAVYCQPTGA